MFRRDLVGGLLGNRARRCDGLDSAFHHEGPIFRHWETHRHGTQVEWETIEAVANTKAIDTWLLFPLGIGVHRVVTRSGEIPQSWRDRLDKLLGTRTLD